MDNTIIQQGRFTSEGTKVTLSIRSDIDWMKVYNYTVASADQTTAVGVEYYWQRGFAAGSAWQYKKSNAADAANLSDIVTVNGFTLIDPSLPNLGALNAAGSATGVTAVSNAAIPVVTNAGVNGLSAGSVVRLFNVTTGQQLGGMDFTVGHNTLSDTTFSLDYMNQIVTAGAGGWRQVNFDKIFYPRNRSITKITRATNAVVTLSVTHEYQVGQHIRMIVPAVFGMVEMNGLLATIISVNTTLASGNTITLDIDSTTFTAFAFPTTLLTPFTPAETVPVGENTATSLFYGVDILTDATVNTSFIGMALGAGADGPAGQDADIVYWVAGKSFSVSNN